MLQGGEDILLSIIVSVYRVEKWIDKCLQSILNCDLHDCELILSFRTQKDKSYEICRGYQMRYDCIVLILQDGTGLSNARNSGLREAKGDYLLFVDGDDFVSSENFSTLLESIRSQRLTGDVIVTDFFRFVSPTGKIEPVFQIGENTELWKGMQFLPLLLLRRQSFWNVWRCLYQRTFLEANQLIFKENCLCEDIEFTTRVLLSNPKMEFFHCPYYFYRIGRENSLMTAPSLPRLKDTIFVLEQGIARMKDSDFPYARAVIAQYQYEYLLNSALIFEVERTFRPQAKELFDHYCLVMADSQDDLINRMRSCISLFGIGVVGYGLHRIKQGRRKFCR